MDQNQKMIKKIRIGTRGSKLALWQANSIKLQIESSFPAIQVLINIVKTQGDADQKTSLTKIGGQGIFTNALEHALIDEDIDLAVHSLKDLPSKLPDSLRLGAVSERGVVNDILIGREISDFYNLPEHANIASGSMRRRAQLLALRSDIQFADLRGNIETRLQKLHEYRYDGIIMAEVALTRLDIQNIKYYRFSLEEILPAVGQGAIGIQSREQDEYLQPILDNINHVNTYLCVSAERAFLNRLDSGCQFPVAASASIKDGNLHLEGLVASIDGQTTIKDSLYEDATESEQIGKKLAEKLINRGALDLLVKA